MLFKISKFFLYAAVFTVAIVSTSTLFPFIVGKYAYFRAVVDLALIFFLLGLALNPEGAVHIARLKKLFRSPAVIAVSAFAAIFVLACLFGVRPSFSFWSNFERGEGGIQIVNLYVMFLLLCTLFKEDADWKKLFWLSMGAATLMIFYGVLAGSSHPIGSYGIIGPKFGLPGFRFEGSVGNPEYVAAYLTFMFFFAAYLLIGLRRSPRWKQLSTALIAFLVLFVAFFVLASTRGAFLGLIAGILTTLAYMGYNRKSLRKWLLGAALIALIALSILVYFRDTAFVERLPGSRLLKLSLNEADLTTRFIMWHVAVEGWKVRPLLGWGPENFLIIFDKHFDPQYFIPSAGFGAWFDRAHSIIFDYLAEIGILGLASYLSIFVCMALFVFRKKWRDIARSEPRKMIVQALFLGTLVAYLVQGLALFDVLTIHLPLFTLFAFAVYYFSSDSQSHSMNKNANANKTAS